MGKKRKDISHAEVWDDSALIQSWDDALTEYKLYHSIQARGERIEDVIKEDEAEVEDKPMIVDSLRQAAAGMQINGISSEKLEEGELEDETESAQAYHIGDSKEKFYRPTTIESEHKQRLTNGSTAVEQPVKPGIPSAIISGVKDEALKNLMMSWYYAGYYTGLYEGQQQAQSHTSEQDM